MSSEIRVPALGESITEATVGKWYKKPGEAVNADEPLVELETDKVTLEVNSPAAGVISEIMAGEGDTVEVGALLGSIGNSSGTVAASPSSSPVTTENKPAPVKNGAPKNEQPAAQQASGGGSMAEIRVPALGESITEATVGKWFKKAGEAVKADEALVELETDKVTLEVNAPSAGVLANIEAAEGATVEVGALLGALSEGAAGATQSASPAPAQAATNGQQQAAAPASNVTTLSPAVRKAVVENNVDPASIEGTGKGGRLLKGDVLSALQSGTAASPPAAPAARAPAQPRSDASREERVRMTKLRQTIARRLKESQNSAAMLTTFNEVDMTAIMSARKQYKDLFEKKHQVKLGFMGFFLKACIHALHEIPAVNAEIEGEDIVYKNYYNIGVAVGTDRGLVVPVVREADKMNIAEIEKTIADFGGRARDGRLGIQDMQGGTFTVSNGGIYGSLMSTPILNAPQSGILGMHKIQERPIVLNGKVEVRPMMYLALTYDHRIVDGREAVTFLVRVKDSLEDPQRLVLDL
ncbi:MAG: 2-oxoglutarate dehydrogenase complex dihydrolipoyllysine-residue succinyltransferase [Hyphomicrobiales bacterium]|nr:2-oxoglutarate dehydrogenase complex dihydrolipoyllysine-residue succinyltransferase [Hyphomicrobiales bacterium]